MDYDHVVHSDFLIHWTGHDIDARKDGAPIWVASDKSKTTPDETEEYLERLRNVLKYGLWMTEEIVAPLEFPYKSFDIPTVPKTCFTELKLSESRKHAGAYGRLGIGVKRPFVFRRFGRPVAYYGFGQNLDLDKFLFACSQTFTSTESAYLLNFFKPMCKEGKLTYDYYSESEWRIVHSKDLCGRGLIVDPKQSKDVSVTTYFSGLCQAQQEKLKYLIPLDGWLAMIIYPSLDVKNRAQHDNDSGIRAAIADIKQRDDHANRVEHGNLPIEVDLDACRNF